MKKVILTMKCLLISLCCSVLLSCVGQVAYELKSPCVANDNNPYVVTPCTRVHVNAITLT